LDISAWLRASRPGNRYEQGHFRGGEKKKPRIITEAILAKDRRGPQERGGDSGGRRLGHRRISTRWRSGPALAGGPKTFGRPDNDDPIRSSHPKPLRRARAPEAKTPRQIHGLFTRHAWLHGPCRARLESEEMRAKSFRTASKRQVARG